MSLLSAFAGNRLQRVGGRSPPEGKGKRVIELEIGDSPFSQHGFAKQAGLQAIRDDQSPLLPICGVARVAPGGLSLCHREHGLNTTADNVVVDRAPRYSNFCFARRFLTPAMACWFSPYFPTYVPNIAGGRPGCGWRT